MSEELTYDKYLELLKTLRHRKSGTTYYDIYIGQEKRLETRPYHNIFRWHKTVISNQLAKIAIKDDLINFFELTNNDENEYTYYKSVFSVAVYSGSFDIAFFILNQVRGTSLLFDWILEEYGNYKEVNDDEICKNTTLINNFFIVHDMNSKKDVSNFFVHFISELRNAFFDRNIFIEVDAFIFILKLIMRKLSSSNILDENMCSALVDIILLESFDHKLDILIIEYLMHFRHFEYLNIKLVQHLLKSDTQDSSLIIDLFFKLSESYDLNKSSLLLILSNDIKNRITNLSKPISLDYFSTKFWDLFRTNFSACAFMIRKSNIFSNGFFDACITNDIQDRIVEKFKTYKDTPENYVSFEIFFEVLFKSSKYPSFSPSKIEKQFSIRDKNKYVCLMHFLFLFYPLDDMFISEVNYIGIINNRKYVDTILHCTFKYYMNNINISSNYKSLILNSFVSADIKYLSPLNFDKKQIYKYDSYIRFLKDKLEINDSEMLDYFCFILFKLNTFGSNFLIKKIEDLSSFLSNFNNEDVVTRFFGLYMNPNHAKEFIDIIARFMAYISREYK